jgi:hypothetical protein
LRTHAAAAALAALTLACSRGPGEGGDPLRADPTPAPARESDRDRPLTALDLDADEVAARLGSFEWTAAVEWTVSREGEDARRVRAVERHRLRQAATGEFEVDAEIDPGLDPGSDTGRTVVYAGGMTYARARYAPFRERPTDRGRDARRFRDESFRVARSIARLIGPGLELRPAGGAQALRRPARKLAVALQKDAAPPTPPTPPAQPTATAADDDTQRRRAFLDGLRPRSASGELLVDEATGAPLRVRLAATFAVEGDPAASATVELLAQVKAVGAEVLAVVPPKGALPDERKAAGVAAALEAAGLKKRAEKPEGEKERGEPAEDTGEE